MEQIYRENSRQRGDFFFETEQLHSLLPHLRSLLVFVFGSGMFFLIYRNPSHFRHFARSATKFFISHLRIDKTIRIYHCFRTSAIWVFPVLQFALFLHDFVCLDLFCRTGNFELRLAAFHRFCFSIWNCCALPKMTAYDTVLAMIL